MRTVLFEIRTHNLLRTFALVTLCFALLGTAAYAQGTGSIVGTVTDSSGAVVPNVNITITDTNTGFVRSTTSNGSGAYAAPELPIGQYQVRVEAPGFKTYEQNGITLNVEATVRTDIQLQVGEVHENVTVEANAVQVQSETSEVSQTVSDTEISQLATNGRNVLQLTTLLPGAASQMPDFDSPVAQFQSHSVNFNGQRSDHNNWLIDGGEAYDRGGGGILLVSPSQDSLQEFKVITSNYAADLGDSSGGMISMSVKSGTKDFHGSAWEYMRNDALDAYSYFSKQSSPVTKPELRYNTFGFNIGGPVLFKSHDPKTFFFYNQEWRREINGNQTLASAPTASQYAGNMTGLGTVAVPNTTDPAAIAKFAAYGLKPGQLFPNDTIPAGLIDPSAAAFLKAGIFETPNTANGLFYASTNQATYYREETARVDHQFTDKLSAFAHLIWDSGSQAQGTPTWTGTTFPTIGSLETVPSWAAVVHATYTISPSIVNEAAFNMNGNNITIADTGKFIQPSGWAANPLFPGVNTAKKMPSLFISGGDIGITYDPGDWPWSNTWRSYQYKDDLSWTHGTHYLKFGGALLHTHKNQQTFVNIAGSYNFNGSATAEPGVPGTGVGLADFLLGDASSYSQTQLEDFVSISFNTISAYAMDDWHITHRLTLNLGLRWEGLPHAYDTNDRASNFYPNLYNSANAPVFLPGGALDTSGPGFTTVSGVKLSSVPFYLNGVGLAGRNGIPQGLVNNTWDTFAPRLGFAYDLTGSGKTVLRGGAGIFYERLAGNEEYNMGSNPPFTNSGTTYNLYMDNTTASWLTGQGAGTSPTTPQGLTAIQQNYKIPTTYQWNLGIQRQLTGNAVMSLAYVGNEADHQSETVDINTLPSNSPYRLNVCGGSCGYSGPNANANPNYYRQYLGYGSINMVQNEGNSNYNSLQASIRATAWKNLTLTGSYTYSHAFDLVDGDLFTNVSDPFNAHYDYGPAGFDRRHIATFSFVYNLPFFRQSNHFVKSTVGGWTLSGIALFQTGNPITIGSATNELGYGGNTSNRANEIAPVTYPNTAAEWFSVSSFANPGPLQWGDSARGSVIGPGRQNWNISMYKTFQFTEKLGFEFRAESFNTFNHTQFTSVNTSINSGTFGQINGTADPRTFQLGARLMF